MMKTKVVRIRPPKDKSDIKGRMRNQKILRKLGKKLREGEVIAIPTETVYGLGANGLDKEAVRKIFSAKGRPSDNPLILHVSDMETVISLVRHVSPLEKKLMERFWPGPLTIIFPKKPHIPDEVTGGLDTVAIRCPKHALCQAFLKEAKVPVAAPSANLSGRPSPTTAGHVYDDMKGKIFAILDGGACEIGLESTVVQCIDDAIVVLRPGKITEGMLREVANDVRGNTEDVGAENVPKAPGMKYPHYSPKGEMRSYVGDSMAVGNRIREDVSSFLREKEGKVGLFISEEVKAHIAGTFNKEPRVRTIIFGRRSEKEAYGKVFYQSLLTFDKEKVKLIIAEGIDEEGIGTAIMNRLEKACDYKVIRLEEKK